MSIWKKARAAVLGLVLTAVTAIAYVRGVGLHLGAAAGTLAAPFTNEETWIVGEIVRDVTEMSSFPSAPGVSVPTIRAATQPHVFTVALKSSPVEIDLRQDVWSPTAFAPLARASFGAAPAASAIGPRLDVMESLLTFTPAALADASDTVGRALTRNMRDGRAHEAAALTLAAFALRESADRSYEARWAMNRITAHLAVAAGLSNNQPGVDARMASAVLWLLAGHQTRALAELDRLANGEASAAAMAWVRALRLRATDDWRALRAPEMSTRLERREYLRARQAAAGRQRGSVEAEQIGLPLDADTLRVIESYPMGVEDGHLMEIALEIERAEFDEVFERVQERPFDPVRDRALANAPATRLVTNGRLSVIPWGAWAEFEQRHSAMAVGRIDSFYRHSLGLPTKADAWKGPLAERFEGYWMFPAATIWWTKGTAGGDADLRYIDAAISETLRAPHRTTAMTWWFLDWGAKYETVRTAVPLASTWFMAPEPRAAYDAGSRVKYAGHPTSAATLAALREEAPYDFLLATQSVADQYGTKATVAQIKAAFGSRMEYDLRPLRTAGERATSDVERLPLLERSCLISPRECLALGTALFAAGRNDEGAARLELAFSDPLVDEVVLSNSAGWLVNYYYAHGRLQEAQALAQRAGWTGSFNGLTIQAYLDERLGRVAEAEGNYKAVDERYDDPSQLLGFYYRTVNTRKNLSYTAAWEKTVGRIFPGGFSKAPFADTKPVHGVIVTRDNEKTRAAGLQAGDIIIGLEGIHVDSLPQYRGVNACFETDDMTITAWRGKTFEVKITTPNRLMGIEFRTYPIAGWKE